MKETWRAMVFPFFDKVWPLEWEFRDASFTPHLINLLVGACHIFPSALERLRPYFCSFDQEYGNLHDITASEIPERFPRETLNLNWFSVLEVEETSMRFLKSSTG